MSRQPSKEENSPQEAADIADTEDIEALKEVLSQERQKAEEHLSGWQRTQADFINYKRRAERDKEDICRYANADLLGTILPILDDLERALEAAPEDAAGADWLEGVMLIERNLRQSLTAQGLTPIEALGQPFDPNLHEAVRQDKGEEGIVVAELAKGYKLHDRVIRPSKVVVGSDDMD